MLRAPARGVGRIDDHDGQAGVGGHLDQPVPEPGGRDARDQPPEPAAAFGLEIDPTGYAVGSESVFDAVAASRSLVTLVGARSRVGWPGGLGLVRLPVVDPVSAYPWSLTWRADTTHQGALRLGEHVKGSFEPSAAGTAVWLARQAAMTWLRVPSSPSPVPPRG